MRQLMEAVRHERPVVYTALVETRGSTPQKAGAAMLVFPDGSQFGTLGGGCVEAEVKKEALQLLASGASTIRTFQLNHDYGWDDGLICGGRMSMLIDPVRSGEDTTYFQVLADTLQADRACTEVITLTDDSSPDRFLLDDAGHALASRHGSSPPVGMLKALRDVQTRPRPYVAAGYSFLPHLKRCRLIVIGAGHVGQKVAELAAAVDFRVWVADDRDDYCSADRFPTAEKRLTGPIEQTAAELSIDQDTFCIIVTRGHNHDEEALFQVVNQPARYIGMIGSKRKIRLIFEDLLRDGVSEEVLSRVHAPIGFDIGSQTVPEIAISIVAELIAHRNLGSESLPPAGSDSSPSIGDASTALGDS